RIATSRPAAVGAPMIRNALGCGSGPRSAIRLQSMATRKQTTASPENTPMKMERIRKKRSSSKSVPRVRRAKRRATALERLGLSETGIPAEDALIGASLTDRPSPDPARRAGERDRARRALHIAAQFAARSLARGPSECRAGRHWLGN